MDEENNHKRTAFGAFDGIKRRCVAFKRVLARTGGGYSRQALRCVRFARGKGKPACSNKVGGGRSPGLINHVTCRRRRARRA